MLKGHQGGQLAWRDVNKGQVTGHVTEGSRGQTIYSLLLWAVGESLDLKTKCKPLRVPSGLCSENIAVITITQSAVSCVKMRPGSFQ